ncbi:MAG TPA: TetR/AcrR family transcriptional regulator [Pseudonocardia sp.]|nr:TetR/AcrR family transcriptional regulator [Pseudonocardia sp.]
MATRDESLPPLSRDMIVKAAFVIADRDGLAAVSMRRVAKELACNPMSLYEHVGNKEELLDLVADSALADLPEIDPDTGWVTAMTELMTALHALLMRYPAVAHIMVARPLSGPMALERGGPAIETLLRAGFDDATAVELFIAASSYTLGVSLYEIARKGPQALEAIARFDTLAESDQPILYRLGRRIAAVTDEHQFQSGLRRLLLGYLADTPGSR